MRRWLPVGVLLGAVGFLSACAQPMATSKVNTAATQTHNANTEAIINAQPSVNLNTAPAPANTNSTKAAALVSPLDRRAERVTKKSFGTYVTPKNSPVHPERFTGYHTGLDFEAFASEAKTDVPVVAACTGKVRARQSVSGYGGVLVQDCVVAGQNVTALYGHLRLASFAVKVGSTLRAGTQFAVLGTGFSAETSNERKHLHFSLHKGTAIDWRGYVSAKSGLADWLDPLAYL